MNDGQAPQAASGLRCLLVGAVATAAFAALALLLVPGLAEQPAGRLDEQLVWGSAAVALAGSAWLWVLAAVVAVEAARGVPAPARPGAPTVLRRLVLAACGVALGCGSTTPSFAAAGGSRVPRDEPAVVLRGLPLPDRPTGAAGVHRPARRVVVRPGDTLWALAGRSLPPGAGDGVVAAGWHRIYALKRDLIGPDPDLIQPGQRLRLPHP